MKKGTLFHWFRNISIKKKLLFTVGIMAVLILLELFALRFSLYLLKGVRASVQQEGVWSKAQKDAVNVLQEMALSADVAEYEKFLSFLEVHENDKIAFSELKKDKPSKERMLKGFVDSGIHPEDANSVVDLFYYFGFISYVDKCISVFWEADGLMAELANFGIKFKAEVGKGTEMDPAVIEVYLKDLKLLNENLTELELLFSSTLGDAARWLDNVVLSFLLFIALTVEISGIILAISLSRGISRGIDEIVSVSKKVSEGDFKQKARVFSNDEIGALATSFNLMIQEVEQINNELKQFAYIASHDLQEPLSTIANFNELLEDPNTDWSEEKRRTVRRFIQDATKRMQNLIRDLMVFSRVGRNVEMAPVDMQVLMQEVVAQLQEAINNTDAEIEFENLPVITGNEVELNQLFQNLISNAIKFQDKTNIPKIQIRYTPLAKHHQFQVQDNGIGILPKHQSRIFEVFQRLHTASEYPGTGIGLSTCKKIVSIHKGEISLESEVGQGSCFTIRLPK